MHIHNVYFWLNSDLDSQDLEGFEQGLTVLTNDPFVKSSYYGKPADTQRDVVENTYTYGLVLIFDDLAAHDQYQVGATHHSFLDDHKTKWKNVIVYDIQTN